MMMPIMEMLLLTQAQEKLMHHAYYDNLLQVQQQTRKRVQRNRAVHNNNGKSTQLPPVGKLLSASATVTFN